MDIAELNHLYQESDACDSELFAEQRSNLLLVAGVHYSKRSNKLWQQLRRNDSISRQQKIRLTKNHIQKISKIYVNNILSHAPGVFISPRNNSELSDQKAAELNNSVWSYVKERAKLKRTMRELCHNFIDFGEAVVKCFWDENAGEFLGYEPVLDPMGAPVLNEHGEPDAIPRFSGEIVFENIAPFNLLRCASAKSFNESRYLILRKMMNVADLKKRLRGDEERLKFVQESSKNVFQVFETSSGSYREGKDMVMVREYYFKKCAEYPNGYYYITTESGILFEGELPFGIFPISYVGFDSVPTYARSYSIIKQARPYQAEINRASSKVAEHQITVGDDKLVLLNGSTMTPGGTSFGIRELKVSGTSPTVIPGRTGEQFFPYIAKQIEEMYSAVNIMEDTAEKEGQYDPFAMLFRSIKEKKKFVIYAEKWEEFYVEIAEKTLEIAKSYFNEGMIIPIIGKAEVVNIAEWKKSDPLRYQIKIEPSSEDVETKMGRQLSLNHIMQYVGQNMDQSDIGKLIRSMPYVNDNEMFSDLTIDYDNARNDIMAMDRGEYIPAKESDNHEYYIKKLNHRMKQADFRYLAPRVQQAYAQKISEHEQLFAQMQQQAAAAQSGYIPSGGYLVACDIYIPHPDPNKLPRRARIPFEAIQWLLKRLEAQGTTQQQLQAMPMNAVADMSQQLSQVDFSGLGGQGEEQFTQANINQIAQQQGSPPESIAPMQEGNVWTQ